MEFYQKKKRKSNSSSFLQAFGPTIFVLLMSCLDYVNLFLPGAEFFFWKLIVPKLVKAFLTFYETRRSITVFTKRTHCNCIVRRLFKSYFTPASNCLSLELSTIVVAGGIIAVSVLMMNSSAHFNTLSTLSLSGVISRENALPPYL